ncbi:hypothetical protein [Gottfriedia solisilvae]|uniref:hypothetical protein n=1 Tax=Gottfriedia solisilvae TaxID=1516104 RepID=UPI003D2F456E
MTNLKLQDTVVLVNGDSRFNNNAYDTVIVRNTIISEGPLAEEYFVPGDSTISSEALPLIQKAGLEHRPYLASQLLAGTEDIRDEALAGDVTSTELDAARLILQSTLVKTTLTPVTSVGNSYVYNVNYTYKIYPLHRLGLPDAFEFLIRLPFDGLTMVGGVSKVQLTVVTPHNVTIDQNETKGIDENNAEIQEIVSQISNTGRAVTSFEYHIDPLFKVRYTHNSPVFAG